ncbi:MAG TPA: CRISPR-associated endonuclease Cas2 [Geothrix sp.]|jgi:CRISPR-associated protein Cas2
MTDLSGYRAMWLLAMFDLPVETPELKRRYAIFRKALLKDGFMMLQYSVYGRFCESEDAAEVHKKRVRRWVPEEGEVRVFALTDRQFAKMEVFRGKRRVPVEEEPPLLQLM